MKTAQVAAACALSLAAAAAMLPMASVVAAPLPDDAMRAALEESKASGKGLTFHVRGTTIGGAVTAIGARFVTVKNQAGIAVIRIDSIDAVAGAITLK